MLHLINFFAPLNISNLLILFLFLISCEIVGYKVAIIFVKNIPDFLRGAIWLLGLGVVIFVYFLSHFFVPLSFPTILIILILSVVLSIRFYIEKKGVKSLLLFIKDKTLPFVIVLLILPQVFIKSSQPPYVWDEMAYHYISPSTLYFEQIWNTGSSFYQNLPRLLETAYTALFSLTNTYSAARVLHFSIFITFLMTGYAFLKKNFGLAVAIVFYLLTIFYKENYLLWSTFGYIDVGMMSFVMIGFFTFLDYIFRKNINSLLYSITFLALAVGTKYSALTQLISLMFISFPILFKKYRLSIIKNKKILIGLAMFMVLGGYWYIKNLIVLGNPIYPFIFGCRLDNCETMSLGYTMPLIFSNTLPIFTRVFFYNKYLQSLFIIAIILSLILGTKKVKKMVIIILIYLTIDLFLLKSISGFEMRYLYHWQILSILIIVTPLSALKKMTTLQLFWKNIRRKVGYET